MASRLLTPVARALLALQLLLILTGGAVRLTGSGLGCPTWPECTTDSYTPVEGQAEGAFHAWIEFGNRLLTFALLAAALLILALIIKSKRRDLTLLGLSQIAGIFGQGILGGITVLTHLNPISVASHFLLSILLVAAAYSLLLRIKYPRAHGAKQMLLQIHTALTFIVIIAGTFLTGAGPHAGDVDAPRLEISIPFLAGIHGFLVVGLILFTLFLIYRSISLHDEYLLKSLSIFLAFALAQGLIGYIQYLQGVPQLLVATHMLGSGLLWISAWRVRSLPYFDFSSPHIGTN